VKLQADDLIALYSASTSFAGRKVTPDVFGVETGLLDIVIRMLWITWYRFAGTGGQ